MTVEQQVDALTASVENLKSAVVSKKATLDASVADAQSATGQAQSAKVNALSARDQAEAFKDAAYTAAQSAASAVAYQDLSAVALTKAVTAVDVFIYDTSKDSDGGAWRHRCAGTSWYREPLNTATRGARREFPAIALIVAEANRITIYDGDDPALPMWMVFTPYTHPNVLEAWRTTRAATSISALNARVVWGTIAGSSSGLVIADFASDKYGKITENPVLCGWASGIASRGAETITDIALKPIIHAAVNDVAMAVLPEAPSDPVTDLPAPLIVAACGDFAAAAGVSIIKADWTVNHITFGTPSWAKCVDFRPQDGALCVVCDGSNSGGRFRRVYHKIPEENVAEANVYTLGAASELYPMFDSGAYIGTSLPLSSDGSMFSNGFNGYADAGKDRLTLIAPRPDAPEKGMLASVTSNFSSGWMPGDIKGAYLSSTDDTDLVESNHFNEEFSSVGDWVLGDNAMITAGALVYAGGSGATDSYLSGGFPTNAQCAVTFTVSNYASGNVKVRPASVSTEGTNVSADGTYTQIVVSSSNDALVVDVTEDFVGEITAISVLECDPDRSLNRKGLLVMGAIAREPVATGAELVAYSGFAASNYLEQPYNPDLPAGDQDICVMGWVKPGPTISGGIVDFGENAAQKRRLLYVNASGDLMWNTASSQVAATGVLKPDIWTHVCATHQAGGAVNIYANGRRAAVGSMPRAPQTAQSPLLVGVFRASSLSAFLGSIALLRISATIPTSDQIRRIYDDEKALFQENAACTLYGSSDAVTALAHDPDAGLLHVGTSSGRSVFKGLRRVANMTVPVATAIAAAGGMVVEQ